MSHLPRILLPAIVLANFIPWQACVFAQSVPDVPNPVCAYCGCSLPNGVHTAPECRDLSASPSGGSKSRGKSGLSSHDINSMVATTLFEGLVASMFADKGASEKEAQAAQQKAIALVMQQAATRRAKDMAAQAEFEKMMRSYKQLNNAQDAGFKTLSNSNLDFKTLDGDMETLAAGARKPFDTAGTLKPSGPETIVGGGTAFFGDTLPITTTQFLVRPENDPNVVDLRNAKTYVVENLKKDSNDLEAAVKPYDDDDGNGQPIVRPPDCVKSAKRLKELIQQRKKFQQTIDLADAQLTTWQGANRNALLNAAKDGLDWYAGCLLERFAKRAEAAERLQRIYEKNAAQMAREGLNIAEIQAKIKRLKALSAAGRLSELASNVSDWQTFIKDGASALVAQLTASNQEVEGMLEDPRMQKYFEAETPELKALLDISKIAASNKVFGKWVARKVPIIAGVELAINESYNALDWYLSYKRVAEANGINGRVLDAARYLQQDIDDTYLELQGCP
ncbi:MAG: hypothetical protein ACM3VT_16880 [Solirubrobacterales bacterium]